VWWRTCLLCGEGHHEAVEAVPRGVEGVPALAALRGRLGALRTLRVKALEMKSCFFTVIVVTSICRSWGGGRGFVGESIEVQGSMIEFAYIVCVRWGKTQNAHGGSDNTAYKWKVGHLHPSSPDKGCAISLTLRMSSRAGRYMCLPNITKK
jgi:hypothetical protein